MKPDEIQMKRRLSALICVLAALLLVAAYFTWCPRFGHGGATDQEQVAALALASGAQGVPARVWVVHNYALASGSIQQDQRTEMLFVPSRHRATREGALWLGAWVRPHEGLQRLSMTKP
jgi:hypothetical protein